MTNSESKTAGAIVLGMHDALVSLTGMIAGLTFALTDRQSIILSTVIASAAAGLSMGASNYLAEKTNGNKYAVNAGIMTSAAYIITCVFLIMPFFVIPNTHSALFSSFVMAVIIIFCCNWCIRHAHGYSWWRHAIEMMIICTIVSAISFVIGEFAQYLLAN
jgi:VIT1/CCC1 family predicted Fe2+/Mn2+ transporter